jgi:two-component system nitrate/nitrite response regulator NarL
MAQSERFDPEAKRLEDRLLSASACRADQTDAIAPIRVAIASPVRLVRDSLRIGLNRRRGIVVVDAVGLHSEGIARITKAAPDVVLVDLGRAEAAMKVQLFKIVSSRAKLVAFAIDEERDDVFACAAAGFSGYVSAEGGVDQIHQALIDATHDQLHCAPHIAAAMFNRLADALQQLPRFAALPSLTARQNEIMRLAEEGRSNKEIARLLQMSSSTVKNHIHAILQKLQVSRRGEAVALTRTLRAK